MIYFIQEGTRGPIKIGYSTKPERRLQQLQTGHAARLRLLHTIPGDRGREALLHRRFAHLRLEGEWFRAEPELLGAIRALQEGRRPAPVWLGDVLIGVGIACVVVGLVLLLGGF